MARAKASIVLGAAALELEVLQVQCRSKCSGKFASWKVLEKWL